MARRLRRSDWIRHGIRTLARSGPEAVTAVSLCDRLGVSRGSFYWHFADIAEFKGRLMDAWEEQNTEAIIRGLERRPPDQDELTTLMRRAFRVRRRLDQAVRRWGAIDPEVLARVQQIDDRRKTHLAHMLRSAGLEDRVAEARALFIYWAFVGHSMTPPGRDSRAAIKAAIDEVAMLMRTVIKPA